VLGVAAFIGGLDYIQAHIGADVGLGSTQSVRFATHDATSLKAGRSEVRFKGIPAGTVTGIEYQNGEAVITASMLTKFGPVYRNAQAEIRPNTPLQDMYLDIVNPGTRSAGQVASGIVPPSQTTIGVNVSSVLDTFDPDVRAQLATLLAELGHGLNDRGAQLREAFVQLAPFIHVMGTLSQQLTVHAAETRHLVHNVGELSRVLASRNTQLRGLIEHGSSVLVATADQRASLNATLVQLPPTLQELGHSFATVGAVLPSVNDAVRRLGPVASQLDGGLSALRAISHDAQPALSALPGPLGELVPLSSELRPFAAQLSSAVSTLRPQMPQLATITSEVAGCPIAPYMFFQWTASITKFEDAMGPYPTGDFGFALDTIPGLKDPGGAASPSCVSGAPVKGTP
jgi:ABC-type transporter Mla subunit MlaD